jgi:hypothetical protein
MPLADDSKMERCGLIQPYEARQQNIYLLASLMDSWGLSKEAKPLLKSLAFTGEGYIYDALAEIQKTELLLKYFPAISEAAGYIYTSPDKAASVLGINLIDSKDLDYYALQSHSIECKTYFSIGFRDTYDSLFHKAWTLSKHPLESDTPAEQILLKYNPPKNAFTSLENLMEQEITFQVFFGKAKPIEYDNNSIRNFCPVCSIKQVLIAEFTCKNTEEEISNLISHLAKNANTIADSGRIIISLR